MQKKPKMARKEVKKESELPPQEEPELNIDEVDELFEDLESLEN